MKAPEILALSLPATGALLLTLFANAASAATPVSAKEASMVNVDLQARSDTSWNRGKFSGCGGSHYVRLDEPVVIVSVARAGEYAMELRHKRAGARHNKVAFALERDGKYLCAENSWLQRRLDPGQYQIYALHYGNSVPADRSVEEPYAFAINGYQPEAKAVELKAPSAAQNPATTAATFPNLMIDSFVIGRLPHPLVTSRPVARFALKKKTKIEISMPDAGVLGLVVLSGKKRVNKHEGDTFSDEFGPGSHRIFVLGDKGWSARDVPVHLREVDAPWTNNPWARSSPTARKATLDPKSDEGVAGVMTPATSGWSSRCGDDRTEYIFPNEAPLEITLEVPAKDLYVDHVQDGRSKVAIAIQTKTSGRRCSVLRDNKARFGARRLDPGKYFVSVGWPKDARSKRVVVFVRGAQTELRPDSVVLDVPKSIPAKARNVSRFVPFFDVVPMTIEERSLLFARLPRSLWHYAKDDLDNVDLRPMFGHDMSGTIPSKFRASIKYPRRNEPMLIANGVGGRYLVTADGLKYKINDSVIAPEPNGAPQLPETMRNRQLRLPDAADYAAASLKRAVKKHMKKSERLEKCWRRYVHKRGGFTSRNVDLMEVTSVNGKITKVEDYGKKVARQADRKCGLNKHRSAEKRLLRRLEKSYLKRGKARMAALKSSP